MKPSSVLLIETIRLNIHDSTIKSVKLSEFYSETFQTVMRKKKKTREYLLSTINYSLDNIYVLPLGIGIREHFRITSIGEIEYIMTYSIGSNLMTSKCEILLDIENSPCILKKCHSIISSNCCSPSPPNLHICYL